MFGHASADSFQIEKYFAGHGVCEGKLDKEEDIESTLYSGQTRKAWLVKYGDGHEEHFEPEELHSGKDGPAPANGDGKPMLIVRGQSERNRICDALTPVFDYLESRITGTCDAQYSCVDMYEICRVVRAFNPNFADVHVDAAFIDAMAAIKPLVGLGLLAGLKRELPAYLAAASGAPTFDTSSVDTFTNDLL